MDTPNVSHSHLKGIASELGAALELPGGKVFNAAGNKGSFGMSRAEKQPDHVKAQKDQNQLMRQMLDRMNVAPVAQHLPAPQVTVVQEKVAPTSWDFEFVRNPDGTLKSIKANPIKEPK